MPPAYDLQEILEEVLGGFRLRHDRNHGVGHWARVMVNGRDLARRYGIDAKVVELFALLHDCRRDAEGVDREHGPRAADYVHELAARGLIRLSRQDLDILAFACRHHSSGRRDGPLLAQVCWDADRLDLGRVGIAPAPDKLCTAFARDAAVFEPAVAAGWARRLPELVAGEWGLTWAENRAVLAARAPARAPLLFHGTLVEPGDSPAHRPFRFRRHEPTLTFDLVTACLVYANPARHPNRERYPEPTTGRYLALRPEGWRLQPPPTGRVWIDAPSNQVRGGVTKWMGGYLTPYRPEDLARRDAFAADFVAGRLRADPDWKRERGYHQELGAGAVVGADAVTPALLAWLGTIDGDLRGGPPAGEPSGLGCTAVGDLEPPALLDACLHARICRWLRRALLSSLRARGFGVVAIDVAPPAEVGEPVLWSLPELEARLSGLSVAVARRPALRRFASALQICRDLLANSSAPPSHAAAALLEIEPLTTPGVTL